MKSYFRTNHAGRGRVRHAWYDSYSVRFVTICRWWLSQRVRHMPELRLPDWYPVVARDPLQLALMSR